MPDLTAAVRADDCLSGLAMMASYGTLQKLRANIAAAIRAAEDAVAYHLGGRAADDIKAASRAAAAAMRERAAGVICPGCAEGIPLRRGVRLPSGQDVCHIPYDGRHWLECTAAAVRALPLPGDVS